MSVYFAYQIYTGCESANIGVDNDPGKLWLRLARHLAEMAEERIETIEVGQVYADSVEEAINCVRSERWMAGPSYGTADAVGYKPQRRAR